MEEQEYLKDGITAHYLPMNAAFASVNKTAAGTSQPKKRDRKRRHIGHRLRALFYIVSACIAAVLFFFGRGEEPTVRLLICAIFELELFAAMWLDLLVYKKGVIPLAVTLIWLASVLVFFYEPFISFAGEMLHLTKG